MSLPPVKFAPDWVVENPEEGKSGLYEAHDAPKEKLDALPACFVVRLTVLPDAVAVTVKFVAALIWLAKLPARVAPVSLPPYNTVTPGLMAHCPLSYSTQEVWFSGQSLGRMCFSSPLMVTHAVACVPACVTIWTFCSPPLILMFAVATLGGPMAAGSSTSTSCPRLSVRLRR